MRSFTRALHARIENAVTAPSVTPLYQNSAFNADSPYFYSRKNNPNVAEFEEVLTILEGASYAVAVTCGMAALYAVLDLLSPGDALVLNRDVYGCTFRLCRLIEKRRGLSVAVLDLSHESQFAAIPTNVRMVLIETPTNPFLKTIGIRCLVDHIKSISPTALVVVDNTWATPLYQHPLEHGADISLHSASKYFSGHSDVMGGALLTNRKDLHGELTATRFYGGTILDPHSAWLLRRSMQTLQVRLLRQAETTRRMADILVSLPQVRRIYYPEVDGTQLTGYGGIVFFELREDLVHRYEDFVAALRLFNTGTGMAAVCSTVARPYTGSHLSMTDQEKRDMGLGMNLVRLCFGLEDADDLHKDLLCGFQAMEEAALAGTPARAHTE